MSRAVTVVDIASLKLRTGSHGRTRDLRTKGFPLDTGVPDLKMEFGWILAPEGYATPRHRHSFDQIRYVMEGEWGVGKNFDIGPGQCGYFPEGVDYGPQLQKADCIGLILQFPGPSGEKYLTHAELHTAQARLEAAGDKFEGGVYTHYLPDGRKVNKDSHKACWEEITGHEQIFPKGRFRDPVLMITEACRWIPDRKLPGVDRKHLGTFAEMSTGMGLVRLAPGAKLPAWHQEDAEIRYLIEGSVVYDGKTWHGGTTEDKGTYFYIPHDCDVKEIRSETGGTFLTISLPMIAEAEAELTRAAPASKVAQQGLVA